MKKLLIPALLAALMAGCSSTPPADSDSGAPVESRSGSISSGTGVARVDASTLAGTGLPKELTDPKSVLSRRSIYFDLDKYDVRDSERELVTAHGKFLANNRQFKMLIQGNTDERGSREYNLSLGQKRADSVKKALILLGAKEEQLESVSLGKEKPVCTDSNEECWAKNRRAELLYKGPTGTGEF